MRNESDIVIPILHGTFQRFKVADYVLPPIIYTRDTFLTNPLPHVPDIPIFGPFELPVWMAWVGCFVILVLLCRIFGRFEHIPELTFGILFQKRDWRRWRSARIQSFVTIWSACALCGLAAYRALMVELLTPNQTWKPFDNPHQLSRLISAGKYQLVVEVSGTRSARLHPTSTDGGWAELRRAVTSREGSLRRVPNRAAGVNIVRELQGSAFATEDLGMRKIEKSFRNLVLVFDNARYPNYVPLVVQRSINNSLKEKLTATVGRLLERGSDVYLLRKYKLYNSEITKKETKGAPAITLLTVARTMWILVWGYGVALLSLFFEALTDRMIRVLHVYPSTMQLVKS